jgi:hypothetical protein
VALDDDRLSGDCSPLASNASTLPRVKGGQGSAVGPRF